LQRTLAWRRSDGAAVELAGLPCHDDAGAYAGHLGVVRDVAADDGASALALAALVAGLTAPVIVLARRPDEPGWRVLQTNPAAGQRFGPGALIAPEGLAAALPAGLQPALAAGAAEAEADGWQLRQVAAQGQTLCLVWQAAAEHGEEQASFSYTVSHDLRAPIRVVEGFTRIVKEDYGRALDRVANDHLDRVLGAAARMNQMIDAMLTLARLSTQPLARQPVNLTQLAGYVIDDLRRTSPEREASVDIEPAMQTQGDPTLLRLVLENLLGNAWKYSGRRAQARIEFGREQIDGRTVYVVRDNGAGFDMRSAERLFGLFQRLHSANDFPGTGVGLASVRRIVQRHGGEIWADGEPGRGAAFYFTLRDWSSPAPRPHPPAEPPAARG
jgi:signal transduction histidine kinase